MYVCICIMVKNSDIIKFCKTKSESRIDLSQCVVLGQPGCYSKKDAWDSVKKFCFRLSEDKW